MPEIGRTQIVQLFLIVLALPIQYILTRQSSEGQRLSAINRVLDELGYLSSKYLSVDGWLQWCSSFLKSPKTDATNLPTVDPPQPDTAITNHDIKKKGYFATSDSVRAPRPSSVRFRVGQVVKHTIYGYKGVIVGWDEVARAPQSWINEMHPKNRPDYREMPNYAVLVDTRDRLAPQLAYVVQENIEIISNTKIFHPLIDHYFENFDGAQYLMRPWMRKTYPQD